MSDYRQNDPLYGGGQTSYPGAQGAPNIPNTENGAYAYSGQQLDARGANANSYAYGHAPYTAPYGGQPMPPVQPLQPARATPPAQPGTPKKKGKGLAGAALLMACVLCGFGGGLAATNLANPHTAVVYTAAESEGDVAVNTGSSLSVSAAAAKASASVVSIETTAASGQLAGEVVGAGSGVILTEDGYILTNHHVVDGAGGITVILPDDTKAEAELIASDAQSDVAVLKVNVSGLTPAIVADSDALQVGDFCLAVGNSMGTLGGSVTDGIISALDREVTIEGTTMKLLQMSAAISPGNSGGGLFNGNGELVGIVNAKSGGTNSEGLGFAIPINEALSVAQQLIESGYVAGRPVMGVSVAQVSEQQAAMSNLPGGGLYIQAVEEGGAAQQAGLAVYDKIVRLGEAEIASQSDLSAALGSYTAGDTVEVEVLRGTETVVVSLTLQEKGSTV